MDRKPHKRECISWLWARVMFWKWFSVPWISSQHFYFLELKSCYWRQCIHTTIFKLLKWLPNCLNHRFEPISENLLRTNASGKILTVITQKKKGESWSYLQLNDNDFTLVLRLSALITNSERPSIYVVPKISVNCVVLEHVE